MCYKLIHSTILGSLHHVHCICYFQASNVLLNSSSQYLIWQKVNKVVIFELLHLNRLHVAPFVIFFLENLSNFIYDLNALLQYKTNYITHKRQTFPVNLFPTPKLYTTLEEKNNNKFCQPMNGAVILMYYLSIKYAG